MNINKKRALRSALILVVALCLSALIAYGQIAAYKKTTAPTSGPVAGIPLGGPFSLHDQTGKVFTEKNLTGKITLLYFGFTFCPAICPTELQKINVAVKKLGTAGDQVQQVFITIDPARDTQKVMAAYVPQFNDHLIGLTGPQSAIDKALKAYKVYARKVEDPKLSDYTMDHSSYVFLIGRDGAVLSLYGADSTAAEISAATKTALGL